jgi:hypothetical protein
LRKKKTKLCKAGKEKITKNFFPLMAVFKAHLMNSLAYLNVVQVGTCYSLAFKRNEINLIITIPFRIKANVEIINSPDNKI